MAIGWMTVLQLVPWTDVIKNAPKVADGAKKLWSAVGNKAPVPEAAAEPDLSSALTPQAQAMVTLQARVTQLEAATNDLHEQMFASSELIKALAEQNTQLIRRAEVNRRRLLMLAGLTLLVGMMALIALTR